MALFQSSVLKDHLRLQDEQQVTEAYTVFTSFFHNPEIQENIRSSKEEQFQATFLNELFVKVLGYTMNPQPGYDLTTEFKNQKNARKADGALLEDRLAIGVIELKGTNTKHLEGIRKQAFDYKANQKGCVYVITSNFEKLRFYINDATEFVEFDLFELNREDFSLLYLCLHKDNIFSNRPLRIKEASIVEEEVITKQFYKDYSVFKRELFRDLVLRNVERIKKDRPPGYESDARNLEAETKKQIRLNLFKKSQKLIDRFLFIFFAEDRGLLPPNSIHKILADWNKLKDLDAVMPLYDRFKLYFSYLDTGRMGTDKKAEIFAYNGGLFKPDPMLDMIEIDDELLYKHTSQLAKYDFESQVDVNILGHIFENSLNEIESVNAEIEGADFDKQKSKRKKDGVFYTPKYITKYIVENTVGRLCEEKKSELGFREEEYYRGRKQRQTKTVKALIKILDDYRHWLLKLTICDPACGSGAFLNQALDFLIKEHQYIDEMKAKLLGGSLVFSDIETTILENNIYGVDINEESVEIAKLSLWLRTAQPRRKLNDLSSNIKCGNSLIDDKKVAGNKAFKWEEEFPEVFANGGFDVVIGNPPYVRSRELFGIEEKNYYLNKFTTTSYQLDLYKLFIEKSCYLLKQTGYLSFITPSVFLINGYDKPLRKFLLDHYSLLSICSTDTAVFSDATVKTIVFVLSRDQNENDIYFYKIKDSTFELEKIVPQQIFIAQDYLINEKLNLKALSIITKIKTPVKIDNFFTIKNGIKVRKELLGKEKKNDFYKPFILGKNILPYYNTFDGDYIEYKPENEKLYSNQAFRTKEIFEQKKLITRQILGERIFTCFDSDHFYTDQTTYVINKKSEDQSLHYLMCLLNSSLISFYFRNTFSDNKKTFPKVKRSQLIELPFKVLSEKSLFDEIAQKMSSSVLNFNYTKKKFNNYILASLLIKSSSKKLQSWHELEFGDFIKELNKAIKASNKERAKEAVTGGVTSSTVEMPQLNKKDEFEWMELFEENKKRALELQREIEKTDAEIDRMVYELYGLTEEEIGIVEAS